MASPACVDSPAAAPVGWIRPPGNGFESVFNGRKSAVLVCEVVTREKPREPPYSVVGRKYLPNPPRKTIGLVLDSLYATPARGCQVFLVDSNAPRDNPFTAANSSPPRRSYPGATMGLLAVASNPRFCRL